MTSAWLRIAAASSLALAVVGAGCGHEPEVESPESSRRVVGPSGEGAGDELRRDPVIAEHVLRAAGVHAPQLGVRVSEIRIRERRQDSDITLFVECASRDGCRGTVAVEVPLRFGGDRWSPVAMTSSVDLKQGETTSMSRGLPGAEVPEEVGMVELRLLSSWVPGEPTPTPRL